MLCEGLQQNAAIVIVPSAAVKSMQLRPCRGNCVDHGIGPGAHKQSEGKRVQKAGMTTTNHWCCRDSMEQFAVSPDGLGQAETEVIINRVEQPAMKTIDRDNVAAIFEERKP